MFDCIIPIGQTCNISLLLQNANIKKHTTLFEWFISPNLNDITNTLLKIGNNTDDTIITKNEAYTFIDGVIFSSHYNDTDFTAIYKRRRDRIIDIIKSSKNILFCRFEAKINDYTTADIDNFINAIRIFNPDTENMKLLFISPKTEFEHPSIIKVVYDKHEEDPYCESEEINTLFTNTLQDIGYNINNKTDICFTDKSEI